MGKVDVIFRWNLNLYQWELCWLLILTTWNKKSGSWKWICSRPESEFTWSLSRAGHESGNSWKARQQCGLTHVSKLCAFQAQPPSLYLTRQTKWCCSHEGGRKGRGAVRALVSAGQDGAEDNVERDGMEHASVAPFLWLALRRSNAHDHWANGNLRLPHHVIWVSVRVRKSGRRPGCQDSKMVANGAAMTGSKPFAITEDWICYS